MYVYTVIVLPTSPFSLRRRLSRWACSTPSLIFSASAILPSSRARWSGRQRVSVGGSSATSFGISSFSSIANREKP